MINYEAIKEVLRVGIWEDAGLLFVDLESRDPRPDTQEDLPERLKTFISHKFTTPYVTNKGYQTNEGDNLIHISLPTMTLSVTIYSNSKTKALNVTNSLKQWFSFRGHEYLKANDLIVQEIEAIEDRTTFLETEYDHRAGFDVILRTTDIEEIETPSIDQVEINNETTGE